MPVWEISVLWKLFQASPGGLELVEVCASPRWRRRVQPRANAHQRRVRPRPWEITLQRACVCVAGVDVLPFGSSLRHTHAGVNEMQLQDAMPASRGVAHMLFLIHVLPAASIAHTHIYISKPATFTGPWTHPVQVTLNPWSALKTSSSHYFQPLNSTKRRINVTDQLLHTLT